MEFEEVDLVTAMGLRIMTRPDRTTRMPSTTSRFNHPVQASVETLGIRITHRKKQPSIETIELWSSVSNSSDLTDMIDVLEVGFPSVLPVRYLSRNLCG